MNIPSSSAASSEGTSHGGPAVSRLGSATCRAIAARIVACAGQKGSEAAGGGWAGRAVGRVPGPRRAGYGAARPCPRHRAPGTKR